jgi:hypothetical protein
MAKTCRLSSRAFAYHGLYYRVDAVNRGGKVEAYEGGARPLVVTQRIAQGRLIGQAGYRSLSIGVMNRSRA